jgi:hypothetical protein
MSKRIIVITGSLNQTTQLHKITRLLPEYEVYFTQLFGDSKVHKFLAEKGIMDNTIMGIKSVFAKLSRDYIKANNLQYDYRAETYGNKYDLVLLCSDLLIPSKFKNIKKVWVQEGMIDKQTILSKIVKTAKLPPWMAMNTSLNGTTDRCDIYFAASEGYKNYLSRNGTKREKIFVTGIPNFDNAKQYLQNDFPHKNYVLLATSDIRELNGKENRIEFLLNCKRIANGRDIIVKLHPNENYERALAEIEIVLGKETKVYNTGDINPMIANCDELVTQYSSCVYIGLALGKKVHSRFKLETLKSLCPIQNGGTSAQNIANLIREFMEYDGNRKNFLQRREFELTQKKISKGQ